MDGQIVFVLWRESIEALLVVGILQSWLSRRAQSGPGMRYLWGGVGAGLAVALVLAFALMRLSSFFSGPAQQYLMTGMVFVASALIVQMVVWMRSNGRQLKSRLETGLETALGDQHYWGVFTLALLAVSREGSETVIFLYGVLAGAKSVSILPVAEMIALGFVAAVLTYLVLQLGSRIIPWRRFFLVSEVLLLLLGCALVVTGVDNLVSLGVLPYLSPLWDFSWVLDDTAPVGGLVASLTGYRAMPDALTVTTWVGYWALVWGLIRYSPTRWAQDVARPSK